MPTYPEIYAGAGRNYTRDSRGRPAITVKDYIVLHNTGSARLTTAADEASYAAVRTDVRSAHYYADKREVLQSLDTDWRAWHLKSRPGNDLGIAYELVGFHSFTREQWLDEINWEALAAQIARDAVAHHIRVQPLTISQIRTGRHSGIITGEQARQAWGGTDRCGPGPNFPLDHLLRLVAEKVARSCRDSRDCAAGAPPRPRPPVRPPTRAAGAPAVPQPRLPLRAAVPPPQPQPLPQPDAEVPARGALRGWARVRAAVGRLSRLIRIKRKT